MLHEITACLAMVHVSYFFKYYSFVIIADEIGVFGACIGNHVWFGYLLYFAIFDKLFPDSLHII